jgi:hypothetical protein
MAHRCAVRDAGDFQVTPAEEEDGLRIIAVPEFTVDGKTQRVPVEPSTAGVGQLGAARSGY